ncbi:MAG: class IV adenylate cyclase [Desulfonatronovibrio sp.]
MHIETELKFSVDSFEAVTRILRQVTEDNPSWYFEKNIVLDDEQGSLKKRDCLLRLRKGLGSKLTFKLPVENEVHGLAKSRQEYETEIGNIQEMEAIFRHLGLKTWLCYEKYRQIWKLDAAKICLDVLPFGRFVEIEGDQENINKTALMLGLDPDAATNKTYHELNQDFTAQREHEPGNDFVFTPDQREVLNRELDIAKDCSS